MPSSVHSNKESLFGYGQEAGRQAAECLKGCGDELARQRQRVLAHGTAGDSQPGRHRGLDRGVDLRDFLLDQHGPALAGGQRSDRVQRANS